MMNRTEGTHYDHYCSLMERHRTTVWRACWRFAHGNPEWCKDMVQEVWIALWLRFDQLRVDANPLQQRAWVWRVARSVLVDLYRKRAVETESLTEAMSETVADSSLDYAEEMDHLLTSLAPDERRLMQMRLQGYDAAEIAEAFGIERNAVYQRVNRIIKKLRRQYGTGL